MKILVCVSRTPETTAKISFKDDNQAFNSDGVQHIMNPYDEWYALVKAVELKESVGGSVTLAHVGGPESDTIIRKGLAIGADEAVRVDALASSAGFVAAQLGAYAKEQGFDLIFLGKESIDFNGSTLGSMLAEHLALPYISFATSLELNGSTANISRDIEGGAERLTADLPLVVSCAKGMAEQRIPNMRGIMMAKRKPLNVIPATAYDEQVKVLSFELPAEKSAIKMMDPENMDELVRLLHEESKVI